MAILRVVCCVVCCVPTGMSVARSLTVQLASAERCSATDRLQTRRGREEKRQLGAREENEPRMRQQLTDSARAQLLLGDTAASGWRAELSTRQAAAGRMTGKHQAELTGTLARVLVLLGGGGWQHWQSVASSGSGGVRERWWSSMAVRYRCGGVWYPSSPY